MDMQGYINSLKATTGLVLAPDQEQELLTLDKKEVNKRFFELTSARTAAPIEFSEQLMDAFKVTFRVQDSPQYQELERSMKTALNTATSRHNDFEYYLNEANKKRMQLGIMLARAPIDFSKQISEVIASGFFKLDHENTLRGMMNQINDEKYIVFTTPDITLKHTNVDAGIDMVVPMGRYRVELFVYTGKVRVRNQYNTRLVDGEYLHPHVAASGSVCWGNGKDAYIKACENYDFNTIMGMLQVILTNYNDNLPYRGLESWDALRNPEKYKVQYVQQPEPWRFEVSEFSDIDASLAGLLEGLSADCFVGVFKNSHNTISIEEFREELTEYEFTDDEYERENHVIFEWHVKLNVFKGANDDFYLKMADGTFKPVTDVVN